MYKIKQEYSKKMPNHLFFLIDIQSKVIKSVVSYVIHGKTIRSFCNIQLRKSQFSENVKRQYIVVKCTVDKTNITGIFTK